MKERNVVLILMLAFAVIAGAASGQHLVDAGPDKAIRSDGTIVKKQF